MITKEILHGAIMMRLEGQPYSAYNGNLYTIHDIVVQLLQEKGLDTKDISCYTERQTITLSVHDKQNHNFPFMAVTVKKAKGAISSAGVGLANPDIYIRPALRIANLEKTDHKIGDCFIFGEKEFEIISPELAFCKSDFGKRCFRRVWKAEDAQNFETSDIKRFLAKWLIKAQKENYGNPVFYEKLNIGEYVK